MGIYKDTIYSMQGNKSLVGELTTKTKITLFLGEKGKQYVGCFSNSYFVDE